MDYSMPEVWQAETHHLEHFWCIRELYLRTYLVGRLQTFSAVEGYHFTFGGIEILLVLAHSWRKAISAWKRSVRIICIETDVAVYTVWGRHLGGFWAYPLAVRERPCQRLFFKSGTATCTADVLSVSFTTSWYVEHSCVSHERPFLKSCRRLCRIKSKVLLFKWWRTMCFIILQSMLVMDIER